MIRVHKDYFVPKYGNGRWFWNAEKERLEFDSREEAVKVAEKMEFTITNGYKFATSINQLEESVFRQEFQRSDNTYDADVILIEDIRNLVLFLAPRDMVTKELLQFLNCNTVNLLLKTTIMYIEYFLRVVEFILIRRDEICGENAKAESEESTKIKRIFSAHLTQHRLLMAREYSKIILGLNDMKNFYHLIPIVNVSLTRKDQKFHEIFLAFCIQVVWIAMHRRCYDLIEAEVNRVFRSEHFKLKRIEPIKFTKAEARLLYGKNYRRHNYRVQNSPLIQELNDVEYHNLPILWLGERKYRGTDLRLMQLEMEFLVQSSQLSLIGVSRGILGHPKTLYNTLLTLNWEMVRKQRLTQTYDPYQIKRQPYLELPHLDEEKIRMLSKTYVMDCVLKMVDVDKLTPEMIKKWTKIKRIMNYFQTKGVVTDVLMKCKKEIQDNSYGQSVQEILKNFIARKIKLRKN